MLNGSADCIALLGSNSSAQLYGDLIAGDPLTVFGILSAAGAVATRTLAGMLLLPWCITAPVFVAMVFFKTIPGLFDPKRQVPKVLKPSVWTIHGKKYDLSAWAKDHPGGEWAIRLGCNRDCTGLFESYHVLADRAKLVKLMARFELPGQPTAKAAEVGANRTGLIFNDAFHEDVKQMLRSHFEGRSHKMKPGFACGILLIVCSEVLSIFYFLKGSTVAMFVLPLLGWMLCCNLAHDGSHFAVSKRPWINSLASLAGMPTCFPSTGWSLQHVIQHHVYTNDEDDVDLYHFLPVCRTSRFTSWGSQFVLQWLTFFFVLPTAVAHLMYTVPIDLLSGQLDAITGSKRYQQCQNLEDFVARSKRWIFGELLLCLSFPVLSVYCQGWWEGLRRAFTVYGLASYAFIVVTQGAHLQGECMVGKEDQYLSWAKRQSATSLNFLPDSVFWTFVTGGLNTQSLHHVAPSVGCSHFPDLYPEYKKICAKHGVPLKECKNLFVFFRGFLSWIHELSRPDQS